MLYLGSFGLSGKTLGFPKHFNTYRKGDILVIEFINNAVLPIRVRDEGHGLYSLWVKERRLFDSGIADNAVLNLSMRGGLTAVDVDVELSVGRGVRNLQTNIGVAVSGEVRLEPYPTMVFGVEEMIKWREENAIKAPEGCSAWVGDISRTPGHSLVIGSDAFVIGFPNGFRFPIMRACQSLRVVNTDIRFGVSSPSGLFLRTKSITEDAVLFRVNFVANGSIFVVDDIYYTREYAEYEGERVKSADLTKWLMLHPRG